MKTITVRQLASIKRTAQNVYPMVARKNKIAAKIEELKAEYEDINNQIQGWEGAVIAMTGGHTSEEVVVRTVTPAMDENGNQKVDSNGRPMNVTKYEPSSLLTFNEEKKVYVISEEPSVEEVETSVQEKENDTFEAPVEEEVVNNEDSNPWGM